jgi:hypothetical protein
MLKPATMYEDILMEKFASILYTEDYYYYSGYPCASLPQICIKDNVYSYAIVDKNDNVIGFFTYRVYDLTNTVNNFGLISFDKGNPIVGIDVYYKMKELLKSYHKLEWNVVGDNPIRLMYDKFCAKYDGFVHRIHDSTRNLKGELVDSFIYEIITSKGA